MFYAYRMTQIHQLCTREDQKKKFRVCSIFKIERGDMSSQAPDRGYDESYDRHIKEYADSNPLFKKQRDFKVKDTNIAHHHYFQGTLRSFEVRCLNTAFNRLEKYLKNLNRIKVFK